MKTNVNIRNFNEVDFGSLTQGVYFLYNNDVFLVVETLEDDKWTNAVRISGYTDIGKRYNFCDNTRIIPLEDIDINYN